MTRRIFSFFFIILFSLALSAPHLANHKPKKPKEALQKDLKGIKNKKKDIHAKLSQTKHKVRLVKGDINSLDHRLNQLEEELDHISSSLSTGRKRQVILNEELQVATKRLNEKREQVRQRLKLMYMRGNADVVAALASSQNVGQFASRKYVFERIAKKDKELFDEVKLLRKNVNDRKQRADRMVVEIANLKHQQESQQEDLSDTRDSKGELLKDLKGKQRELERMESELESEENSIESEIAAYNRGKHTRMPAFTGRFTRPVNGPITSGFGMRYHPILHRRRMHKGIDISAHNGTPVHAPADGIVISARYGSGYGNNILLDHGSGISTLYGHLSRMYVSSGQRVKRGQVIGAVGSTGMSTGNHLHWEVHVNGRAVNPLSR